MICKGTTNAAKPCKNQAIDGSEYCAPHQHSSITVRERCHGISKTGRPCKNVTLRGIYCNVHHRTIEGLRITNSTLPDANFGLFALKQFRRGENIAPYDGDLTNLEDDYALQIKKNPLTFISARRTNTGAGRYANARLARLGQGPNNSQLVYDRRGRIAHLKATKTIEPKQEITTAYGRGYWSGHHGSGIKDKFLARLPLSPH